MSKKEDVLGREEFILKLEKLVSTISDSRQGCCFAIDGAWGSGKSFVLEKFENRIKDIQLEETGDNRYFVFHYDCWKYDYYEEPVIAIISAMLDVATEELSLFDESTNNNIKLGWNTVKGTLSEIAKELCKNKIGIDLVTVAEEALKEHEKGNESSFDLLYGFKRALEKTREGIKEIAENKTVIFVVDELDRCLPTYTIKILERLHHIFCDIDNVIVIISMDKKQIEHSIQGIYGNIEVDVYLRKFITFEINLKKGKTNGYLTKYDSYTSMFEITDNDEQEIEQLFSNLMNGMDMRTQEKIFRKAEIIHNIVKDNEINDSSIMTFEIMYMTIILLSRRKNVKWIIEGSLIPNVENTLGRDYYNMIKEYRQEAVNQRQRIDELSCVNDNLIGKTFFWLANLYSEYNEGECTPFFYSKQAKERVKLVKKFAEIVEIMGTE